MQQAIGGGDEQTIGEGAGGFLKTAAAYASGVFLVWMFACRAGRGMQIGYGSKTKEDFAGTAKPSLCAISRQLLFFLLGNFLFGCFFRGFFYGFLCGFLCHASVTSFQVYSELWFSLLCQRALYLFCYYTKLSTKSLIFLHFFSFGAGCVGEKKIAEMAGLADCFQGG